MQLFVWFFLTIFYYFTHVYKRVKDNVFQKYVEMKKLHVEVNNRIR